MKKLTLFALAFALLTSCSSNDDEGNWKIQCKLPPKTKRFCPLVLK